MKLQYTFQNGTLFRIDDDGDITWVTTENGNKIGMNFNNGDIVGNPYVVGSFKENLQNNSFDKAKYYGERLKKSQRIWQTQHIMAQLPIDSVVKIDGKDFTKLSSGEWISKNGHIWSATKEGGKVFSLEKMATWNKPVTPKVERNSTTVDADDHMSAEEYFSGETDIDVKAEIFRQTLIENGGIKISPSEAKDMLTALSAYSDEAFEDLKEFEHCGVNKDIECGDFEGTSRGMYKLLNKFIDISPKVEGVMYRGTRMPKDELTGIGIGSKINLGSVSSFTTDKKVIANFAEDRGGKVAVVFKTDDGIHRATSITPFSDFQGEDTESEVLSHADSSFTVTDIKMESYPTSDVAKDILTIYIKENES